MIVPRSMKRLTALLALLGALLALPAAAQADRAFLPKRFPAPTGPEVPSPLVPENALTGFATPAKSFKDACGLAVDSGGQIYVSDHDHDVIDVFSGSGGYQGQIEDLDPLGAPCGLALIGTQLYLNDYRRGVYAAGSSTPIDPGPATGIAVDPKTNRLYVTHSTYVAVYQSSGEAVMDGLEPLHIGEGYLQDAYGAAVSAFSATSGYLYVADATTDTVAVFDPATDTDTPIGVLDGSLGPQQGFRDLRHSSLAVDQANGNLLVVDSLDGAAEEPPVVVDEFSPQGNFRGQLPHAISGGEPAGIAVDPTNGQVYVTTGRNDDSGVYAFAPAGPSNPLYLEKAGTGKGTVTSAPAKISCPASCSAGEAEFDVGSNVTLKATAAPHSVFTGWSVAGQPGACPGTGNCQVSMSADAEVIATFTALPQETMTVTREGTGSGTVQSEPAGIDCGTECSASFDQGSTVTLTAAPAPYSHLASWSVAGNPSACEGTEATCEVTLNAAAQVSVVFAQDPDRNLAISLSGAGRVTSTPAGIDCPGACSHAFPAGTQVSLNAQPAPDWELATWTGACRGKRGCAVTMVQNQAVGATFAPIEHPFAVSVIGAGTGTVTDAGAGIDCGLACAGIYQQGSVLHLSAKAEAGSRFEGFAGCDSVQGETCTVSITEAKTVTALFGEAPEIALGRLKVDGKRATLVVRVPAPGLVRAWGSGITKASERARSEGALTLKLQLDRAGRRALAKAKDGRLAVKVTIAFTSSDGSRAKKRVKPVTFIRRGGGR